ERNGGRAPVVGVRGRGEVLEGLVVRHIVANRAAYDLRTVRTPAAGRAIRVGGLEVESALEPSPAHIRGVEQVPNIAPAHREGCSRRTRANVAERIRIGNVGQRSRTAVEDSFSSVRGLADAVGLAGDEIQRADSRG